MSSSGLEATEEELQEALDEGNALQDDAEEALMD